MASPQVANLAAKIWAVNSRLTVEQVKNIIVKTATPSEEGNNILLLYPSKAVEMAKSL